MKSSYAIQQLVGGADEPRPRRLGQAKVGEERGLVGGIQPGDLGLDALAVGLQPSGRAREGQLKALQ
jgi:hypothetical protein